MKPFTFYDIYYTPLKELDDKHAGKFFRMICDFLDGKQVTIDAESDAEISPEFELYWESISSDLEAYRKSAGKSCGLDKRYKHFPFLPFYQKAFTYLSDSEGGAFVKMIGAYMFENKAPTKADGDAFKYFNINDKRRNSIINYQVLRIKKFKKGDLAMIGAETERTAKSHRNEDIDSKRTPLNYYFKKSDGGLAQAWNNMMQNFEATYKETKKSFAFEGLVITSGHEFFIERGYVPGEPLPRELQKFFEDCYAFALRQIGYHGTDKNILSAVIHLDETTPHLQLYYIPIVDEGRKKVYAKGADGKVLRNEKGSPVQAKDSSGKSIFTSAKLKRPKVCSSEFWEQRGAQISYGNLQDEFHEQVAWRYGLERGEVGNNKKHTTKYQWKKQQQEKELAEKNAALTQATAQIEEADRTLQDKNADISAAEKKLEQIQFRADIAEGRQAYAERATQQLESERERLTREVAPLSAAAEAFRQASRKKPDKKQIPALLAENARLKTELKYSHADQHGLYTELQKSEKEKAILKREAEITQTLIAHAPDKLQEAMDTAKLRQESKHAPFRGNSSSWTK